MGKRGVLSDVIKGAEMLFWPAERMPKYLEVLQRAHLREIFLLDIEEVLRKLIGEKATELKELQLEYEVVRRARLRLPQPAEHVDSNPL